MTGRRKVRLANGREASALDIQQEYLSKARDFVDRREISTPLIERALDLWERGLKAVESDDLGLVEREIDWVIKWKLIDRYRAKHGLPLGHPRIAQLDLAYHDIHRGRGLYYLLEKRGAVARVTTDLQDLRGQVGAAADHPGPAARRVHQARPRSAAATSPSTGCTSSSTTRPSARCCARTRSGPTTSGCTSSSTACDGHRPPAHRCRERLRSPRLSWPSRPAPSSEVSFRASLCSPCSVASLLLLATAACG